MQVGKVSWVGQTFALARCGDSQGKKPRNRRTKEERRKMVESFIKRYRDSNKGNFPSLNLTHKEVGGSFYIVREIVREIIQENKVLRPGSLNSQAFNLEDCSEQHLPEHFSSDYMYSLSLTTIEHSDDERQKESSDCNNSQNVNEVSPTYSSTFCDHDTTNIQEEFALRSQGILVPHVIDGDSHEEQHCKSWHSSADATNEESMEELIEPSGQGQSYSATQSDEEICIEVKDNREENCAKYESENPVGLSQPLSITSTFVVSMAKNIRSDLQVNDTNMVILSSIERENAFDKLESLSSSGLAKVSSSKHAGEVDPLESSDSTISGSEQMSLEKAGALDTPEQPEANGIASKNVFHMPVCLDQTLSLMESPRTIVDQKADVQPPLISSNGLHMDVVTSVSGRASGEIGLKNCISDSNAAEKSNSDGTNRESSDVKEKMENTEANSILAIIKGLVTAFIKFWTE
uniref:Chaperonin n=1 Tax=Anthurium amnicola TaxID=1678845 RepID=A0A1D1XS14_9ARAE